MRNILLIFACLVSASMACAAEELLKEGPFALVDLSALPEQDAQIIREANEDFICVLQGRKPKNIKFDESYALTDGGTVCYKGKGYSLTIVQSLSSFGQLHGYIYGPVIAFDKKFAPGNRNTVSSLRFYTNKQLKGLMSLSGNPAFSKDAEPSAFPRAEEVLKTLVEEKADVTTNHLYVSPVKKVGKDEFAWVYWKEKRQLIRWEPFDAKSWKKALLYSRQILDIDKDVVPTAEDIKGSTYLVDEGWACRAIGDCMKNGREYIIQKDAE